MTTRIAITSKTCNGFESLLDPVFGRAAVFTIINGDTGEIETELENHLAALSEGAGTGVAALMKEERVSAVISGRFGPKAYQALSLFGISMWNAPEGINVKEALSRFKNGALSEMKVRRY